MIEYLFYILCGLLGLWSAWVMCGKSCPVCGNNISYHIKKCDNCGAVLKWVKI